LSIIGVHCGAVEKKELVGEDLEDLEDDGYNCGTMITEHILKDFI